MQIERISLDGLTVAERHRQADPARVATLSESMARHGQLQPITVYQIGEYDCGLIAGLHRVEAARKLGWEEIDAVFVEADDVEREMLEIAENLHRVDLTKDERDRQIRRYAELLEARKAALVAQNDTPTKVRSDGRKAGPQHEKGVARQIAEETGLSKSTVLRAINPPAPKPQPPARDPFNEYEATQRQVDRLMAAWNAAGKDARETFLSRIDDTVFDQTQAGAA